MNLSTRNVGQRAEYRQRERQRASESATLADKFPDLSSMTVTLEFASPDGRGQPNPLKYVVNLATVRSVFTVDCPNEQCVGGDFDLSNHITLAISQQQTTARGELTCQGWPSHAAIGSARCGHILRYKLDLVYEDSMPQSCQ